jgi:uncharacterized repeat protein (TIGR01451 family)
VTVTYSVAADVADATVSNTASASSDEDTDSGSAELAIVTRADLEVEKSDSPDPVVVLEELTYWVEVTNLGPSDAQTVSLSDTLPTELANAKYCSYSAPLTDCVASTPWASPLSLGTMTAGATTTVKIVAKVASRPSSGVLSNTAAVSSATTDPESGNDQSTEISTVNRRASSVSVICTSPVVVNQSSTCTATVSDPDLTDPGRPTGTVTFTKDAGDNGAFSPGSCTLPPTGANQCSVTYTPSGQGDGSHGITATYGGDAVFLSDSDSTAVLVNRRATTTNIACTPMAQQVNQNMTCTATVTDVETNGTKTPPDGVVTFSNAPGDLGTFPGGNMCTLAPNTSTPATDDSVCSVQYTSATPTVDALTAEYGGSDVHLPSNSAASMPPLLVVFFDPSGGFVTGGGWIIAQAGSYRPDPTLSGRANFGFNSKYKKGANVPDGQTEFQFQVGNLNFHSESYQWLVVSACKAQYKGTGTINGQAGYGFLLTAYDGDCTTKKPDMFRIKIWKLSDGSIVFDNNLGGSDDIDAANPQIISGGSIVVHK